VVGMALKFWRENSAKCGPNTGKYQAKSIFKIFRRLIKYSVGIETISIYYSS